VVISVGSARRNHHSIDAHQLPARGELSCAIVSPVVDVPVVVRNKAAAIGASAWLETLDDLVAEITLEWGIALGRVFSDATEAFVAEATLADGATAVLKLVLPTTYEAAAQEITVLRIANGDGCARLMRHDQSRGALLLERLGPSMFELGLQIEQRHTILAATAARVWRGAPDCGLPTGAEKARTLMRVILERWEALDRPCSERAIADAVACAERRERAHDDERAVLVHGDVHQWNALQADDGFKLIDPDGLLAEAEYDLGVMMREDPVELLEGDPHTRARKLAAATNLDATAIWEWGVIERVSTGLLATMVDLQPVGREMLATADVVSALSS
jgi:streptomycin 6-kinase